MSLRPDQWPVTQNQCHTQRHLRQMLIPFRHTRQFCYNKPKSMDDACAWDVFRHYEPGWSTQAKPCVSSATALLSGVTLY